MITYNFGVQNGRITAGVDVGKMMKESVSKTSYGDTSIEDYVNDNFNGSSENKQKFIDAMKKKTTGKDYFNGLNMSAKDWESEGKKFSLSRKPHSVTESKHLNEAAETLTFSAFITNLGKYNEGELVGKWVEFPIDEDDFEEELAEIGIGSTDEFGQPYEEWFVTDYDTNIPGFSWEYLGEYPSYEDLQRYGELAESIDDVEALNNVMEVVDDLEEAIDGLENGNIIYYPGFTSLTDFAEYFIDECGGVEELGIDTIESYFDYEALGRDLSFDTYEVDNGIPTGVAEVSVYCAYYADEEGEEYIEEEFKFNTDISDFLSENDIEDEDELDSNSYELEEYCTEKAFEEIKERFNVDSEDLDDYSVTVEPDIDHWVDAGTYLCGDSNASNYEIGEAFVSHVGMEGVGNPEYYFDYEAYGRDLSYEGYTETSDGVVYYG